MRQTGQTGQTGQQRDSESPRPIRDVSLVPLVPDIDIRDPLYRPVGTSSKRGVEGVPKSGTNGTDPVSGSVATTYAVSGCGTARDRRDRWLPRRAIRSRAHAGGIGLRWSPETLAAPLEDPVQSAAVHRGDLDRATATVAVTREPESRENTGRSPRGRQFRAQIGHRRGVLRVPRTSLRRAS